MPSVILYISGNLLTGLRFFSVSLRDLVVNRAFSQSYSWRSPVQKDDLNQKEVGAYTFALSGLHHSQAGGLSIHVAELVGSEGDGDLDGSVQPLSTAEIGGDVVVFISKYSLPGACGIMITTPSI